MTHIYASRYGTGVLETSGMGLNHMHLRLSFLLIGTVMGCSDSSESDSGDTTASGLSYYQDIKPILDAHCVDCHKEDGVGAFPLSTFEEVDVVRTAVAASMESGSMPPWKATDECNDYKYNTRVPQTQIDAVSDWVAQGAAEGRPDNEGERISGPDKALLSRVDHSISMRAPYVPTSSPDDYRCFLVDWPYETDQYVTGYSVVPNNDALVHHVITFIAEPDQVEQFEAADAAEDGEGWTCFGSPGAGVSLGSIRWLGAWAPGGNRGDFPEGTGIPMDAGSKLVLQVHMNANEDNTEEAMVSMDVSVESEVEHPALIQPWTNPQWVFGGQMPIPANSTDVTHQWGYVLPSRYAFTVHSASLHMHTFGKTGRFFVEHADGTETCLLNIDDWDFNWQRDYDFQAPIKLEAGDKLSVRCSWDNPTDEELNWGEGTGDEMCLATMFVTSGDF